MQIYLPEVKQKQGKALQYRFQGKNRDYLDDSTGDENSFSLVLSVRGGDDEIMISGEFQAVLEVNCSRCLKSFQQQIVSEVSELFTVSPLTDKKKTPAALALETANQLVVSGDYLYLDEYIRQLFIISLVKKPLCRPDCRGLCANCGVDLNEADCLCENEDRVDSRLLKLKEFRPDR